MNVPVSFSPGTVKGLDLYRPSLTAWRGAKQISVEISNCDLQRIAFFFNRSISYRTEPISPQLFNLSHIGVKKHECDRKKKKASVLTADIGDEAAEGILFASCLGKTTANQTAAITQN